MNDKPIDRIAVETLSLEEINSLAEKLRAEKHRLETERIDGFVTQVEAILEGLQKTEVNQVIDTFYANRKKRENQLITDRKEREELERKQLLEPSREELIRILRNR
ncbi:hypothetical protein IQ273_12815 [Nodosilinea sp. LEGE 07298]|uniref:hypothetical protein n=1 Tax=Nodosilinea sp. LEGE 07298 TaxID=2777970 RepID=UPI001881AD8E|nr:hypothetical protein [Nodosilinea sp. LEGE 07298]MBE9110294.1 hypothetical protein [Nodosilinea sp. LEGE 07298]